MLARLLLKSTISKTVLYINSVAPYARFVHIFAAQLFGETGGGAVGKVVGEAVNDVVLGTFGTAVVLLLVRPLVRRCHAHAHAMHILHMKRRQPRQG